MVAVHNLGAEPRTVPLALEDCDAPTGWSDLLQDGIDAVSDKGEVELRLEGYGYRWLRVVSADSRRARRDGPFMAMKAHRGLSVPGTVGGRS